MELEGDTEPWKAALVVSSDSESESGASSIDRHDVNMKALSDQLEKHEADKRENLQELETLDAIWQRRRKPYLETAAALDAEIVKTKQAIHSLARWRSDQAANAAPGPASLSWVEDTRFTIVCNAVIVLNLVFMALAGKLKEMNLSLLSAVLANLFLMWYIFELAVKFAYRRQTLFIGKCSVVWWSWLDLLIVVSGVLDEWLLPLLDPSGLSSSAGGFLKFLRFFRLMRIVRLLRQWFHGDFAWTESPAFECFMTGVITVNSVSMAVELDYDSPIWPFVENMFLTIYTFELCCRIKYEGCRFFTNRNTIVWNSLDLIMVTGGVVDLWLLPGIDFVESIFMDEPNVPDTKMSGVLSLLKLMRILRVLRLVRLLKSIKPLYGLLMGIGEALQAMQWVLLLTLLLLYAGAIVFTTLISQELVGPTSEAGKVSFGTVPHSLLSLFELMNGNISIVDPITHSIGGQLSFAIFMVISNWAILATLTSVVSDSMLTTSQREAEEDAKKAKAMEERLRCDRLRDIMSSADTDGDGIISEKEWNALWRDSVIAKEMVDASGLSAHVLQDVVRCLVQLDHDGQRIILIESLIAYLDDNSMPADNRSVMHVTSQLQDVKEQLKVMAAEIASRRHLQ